MLILSPPIKLPTLLHINVGAMRSILFLCPLALQVQSLVFLFYRCMTATCPIIALVVDLDANTLFGEKTSPIVPPKERRLTSTNPEALHIYITHMRKHLREKSDGGNWTEDDTHEWETIDDLLRQGQTAAENKCPGLRSGQYPYSPELDRAGKRLLYWKLRLKEYMSLKTNRATLADLASAVNISVTKQGQLTSKAVRRNTREARRILKAVQADSTSLREQHLAERASLAASLHGMDDAAALAAIKARE
jgi:hypothetical protein